MNGHQGKPQRDSSSAADTLCCESLEARRLLATVSVAAYGAVPNDGLDDAAAIDAAINASAAGDTVFFPAGTYNLSRPVNAKGAGRSYIGQQGAKLISTTQRAAIDLRESNATFQYLAFEGRGIFIERIGGGMIEGVVIDNCSFNVYGVGYMGGTPNGILFTTGLRNTQITNNTFDPIAGDNGILGWYWDNLLIANNAFLNGNEGMHIMGGTTPARGQNLLVEQNYFAGLHRMGIEIQGGGFDTIIQDNYYELPVLYSQPSQNLSTFAYSLANDVAQRTIIRRNTAIAPERPDGIGVRVGFELSGYDLVCEDNYVVGTASVLAANGAGATGVARHNRISDYLYGPYNANGAKVQFYDNGPNVNLTWDINRGKPGPNHRLGTEPPGPSGLLPPVGLSANAPSPWQIDLAWYDRATVETGYLVESSLDGVTWTQIAELGADSTQHVVTNLSAATTYQFRVRAVGQEGYSDYSNIAIASTRSALFYMEDPRSRLGSGTIVRKPYPVGPWELPPTDSGVILPPSRNGFSTEPSELLD